MASVPSSSSAPGPSTSSSTTSASCPDPDVVAVLTMRKAMGALLDNVGFTHAHEGPLNVLTDVAVRFMEKLCKEVKLSGEYCGRSQPAVDDLGLAFKAMKFDQIDFHSYLSQVSPIAPIPPLPLFPVELPQKRNRINGYKASREEKKNRPPHIPRHLPGIRPSGEEKEEAHVPVASTSTTVDNHFESRAASFEKSKGDYLSRFECDLPGFVGAAATNYGMRKADKDKNPPALVAMKEKRSEDERRRVEEEARREAERRNCEADSNGIHHKFKKHKEKEKEKVSRPPSMMKGVGKPHKEKTPHKIKEKSRTNTPIIRHENAPPLLQPEVSLSFTSTFHLQATTSSTMTSRVEKESSRPPGLDLFDDPAEETDIPLPRTPGNHVDSPDEPLFYDGDPFGRNSAFNAPSTSTPVKSAAAKEDEEKRRREKEERKARKEEKKARKAEAEATAEAIRVAARADANLRERERKIQSSEQERAAKEKREREKAEERRKAQAEERAAMERALMLEKERRTEELKIKAAQIARAITEENERKQREKAAKEEREKKRKEEKRKADREAKRKEEMERTIRALTAIPPRIETPRRSATPRVETPKPRELEAIRVEEDKEDSSTIPFVMEDEPVNGPTSFPLNMTMEDAAPRVERTVTPIKIKTHGGEREGEKSKKKHKKDKKEREEEKDSSHLNDEERRRAKKEKKREKREKEERERVEKEKRVDQSPPIQDKIDPNKSGLKLTIKLGGVSSQPAAPPPLVSTTPVPVAFAFDHRPEQPTSLLKLKIKTPIDPKMEAVASSSMSSSQPVSTPVAPPKPRPVTKAELKATPASMPSLFQEDTWVKHKHKKHKHAKASCSDSSSSSDEEERRKRKERKREKEKERQEKERKAFEEKREKEKEKERVERKEREKEMEREKEREKQERKEKERQERIKQEKEKERIEKEKRDREREREREQEREKKKAKEKKKTAFDLALQPPPKKKKEEPQEVIWICPVCSVAYVDGAEMIGCDCCDSWFHWQCVGIVAVPEGDNPWFCERCTPKNGELPNYGENKKKCTHWSGQYMDWNIKKSKKSRNYD